MNKRRKKGDSGIAILKAKMSTGEILEVPIPEAVRDAINKKIRNRDKTVKPRYDDMTTQELEKHRFSGFRLNDLANQIELWCDGKIAATEQADRAAMNPALLAEMHEKVFQTTGSLVELDVKTQKPSPKLH